MNKTAQLLLATAALLVTGGPTLALDDRRAFAHYLCDFSDALATRSSAEVQVKLSRLIEDLEKRGSTNLPSQAVPLLDNSISQTKLNPQRELLAEALALRGSAYRKNKRFKEAAQDLERAVKLSPDNAEIRFRQAEFLKQNHQTQAAVEALSEAARLKGHWYKPLLLQSEILLETGRKAESQKAASQAFRLKEEQEIKQRSIALAVESIKSDPRKIDTVKRLVTGLIEDDAREATNLSAHATVLLRLEKYDEALLWANLAIRIEPRTPAPHLVLLQALYNMARQEEFRRQAERTAKLFPNNPEILAIKAVADFTSGNVEQSLSTLRDGIARSPRSPALYKYRAYILNSIGQLEPALTDTLKHMELQKPDWESYFILGNIYMNLGRLQEANQALQRSITLCPPQSKERQKIEELLSSNCRMEGNFEEGKKHIERAKSIGSLAERFDMFLKLGWRPEVTCQNAILAAFPEHPMDPTKLIDWADKMLKTEPKSAQARYLRGLALMCKGEQDEAADELRQACALKNWRGAAAGQAAILAFLCLERAGRTEEGKNLISRLELSSLRPWQKRFVSHLEGRLTVKAVSEQAKSRHLRTKTMIMLAYRLGSQGQKDASVALLNSSRSLESNFWDEAMIAEAELTRLRRDKGKS